MDADVNMQKSIDAIEDDYEMYKRLQDKLDFLRKFNMFLDHQFQNGKLSIEEYKTSLINAKKINEIVLQF